MNQDLFSDIPSEIVIGIISKLPLHSIISCKCVCKSWLTLLESGEFVKSQLLKSIPGLAVYRSRSKVYNLFEFDDGLDIQHHGLHYKPLTEFNIPACNGRISGTANGLLFLRDRDRVGHRDILHICNPITRDYIQLDHCNEFVDSGTCLATYGFGSSKMTGQHKVVRISQHYVSVPEGPLGHEVPNSECVCHVYTVGTGLWRRISLVTHLPHSYYSNSAFLNGNLHWSVSNLGRSKLWISCFDLETELFNTYSSPLLKGAYAVGLTILKDCLCISDNTSDDGFAIWLMKEYGVEKSWTKQFFVSNKWPFKPNILHLDNVVYPIKKFKDGDILLVWQYDFLYYSKKNNTVQKLEMHDHHNDIQAFLYTPSFLSLKSFGMEKVISF